MSTKNFPSDMYIQEIDSGVETYLGSYTPTESIEVAHAVVSLFKKGVQSGSEQLKLKIYEDESRESLVMESNLVTISDIPSLTSSDWIGDIRFDFDRSNLVTSQQYFVTIEPTNYTKNTPSFYLSTILDWPVAINSNTGSQAGSKLEIWGYK